MNHYDGATLVVAPLIRSTQYSNLSEDPQSVKEVVASSLIILIA